MTEQTIYDSIASLDDRLRTHRQEFEKWTTENKARTSADDYQAYVTRFLEWEKGVLEKKKELFASLPAAGADRLLNDALSKVSPMEFLMAMMTMSMKDQSFLKSVLSAHKQIQQTNEMKQAVLASAQPVHGPANNPAAVFNPTMPPPTFRPTTIGNNTGAYGYTGRSDLAGVKVVPMDWTSEPSIKRAFRPPSPIAEYKNNTLPFKDFSQA